MADSVLVSPPRCRAASFPLAAFLDSLRVELAGRRLRCCTLAGPGDSTPMAAVLKVKVEVVPCVADAGQVQVLVRDPADSRTVEREVFLADVQPSARPRALALAVAELIRVLGQGGGGEVAETAVAPAPRPPPRQMPLPRRGAPPVGFSVRAEGEVRSVPTGDTMMWGGRARLAARGRILHTELDLGGDFGHAQSDLGDVLVRSASAGFGMGPRLVSGVVNLDLGLHAELGWLWIRGEPAFADVQAGAGSDWIAAVGPRLSLEAPARGRIRPGFALETGWVIRGVRGEVSGQPVVGGNGYYLLASVGIAASL